LINELERRIGQAVSKLAPAPLQLAGVGALSAAKIVPISPSPPVRSKDALARHKRTAPLPVRSGNSIRRRLSRTGNRQLYSAIHRIAVTLMGIHEAA
jgi:transposase